MAAIYNEIEPYAAQWIRNLAAAGHIAGGVVDERSIKDIGGVGADAIQFHAFAGIGVWSYALRLAGWPDDCEVWTGSCPCQPFSAAGKRRGTSDERHLWPDWFRLIDLQRPPVVFGEQVASPDGLKWFDDVSSDLESAGYSVGASDLCAAGVGAPHIRQRLYFVAIADGERLEGVRVLLRERRSLEAVSETRGRGADVRLGDPCGAGLEGREGERRNDVPEQSAAERAGGNACRLGNAGREGGRRDAGGVSGTQAEGDRERCATGGVSDKSVDAGGSFWQTPPCDWLPCRDGKLRPTQPGLLPLAHGAPARVGRLRAYGNAIVPQVAATFIASVVDVIVGTRGEEG